MWLAALKAIIGGAVIKKPIVVPMLTTIAVAGEINIAIKIATWLAKVKLIGPRVILGINIGTTIPIAQRRPAITMFLMFDFVFIKKPPKQKKLRNISNEEKAFKKQLIDVFTTVLTLSFSVNYSTKKLNVNKR